MFSFNGPISPDSLWIFASVIASGTICTNPNQIDKSSHEKLSTLERYKDHQCILPVVGSFHTEKKVCLKAYEIMNAIENIDQDYYFFFFLFGNKKPEDT